MILLSGVPGSGKTTVLSELRQRGMTVASVGDLVWQEARATRSASSRDELRLLEPETLANLRNRAFRPAVIAGLDVLESHLSVWSPKGLTPALPEPVIGSTSLEVIALLEADAGVILDRRQNDRSRARQVAEETAIQIQQEFNRSVAATASVQAGATVFVLDSSSQPPGRLAKSIARIG